MGIEDSAEQQYQHHAEDDIGKHVEIAVIEHQDNESQYDRRANPHNLHARTCVETEQIGFAIAIAGTTHAHPSEDEQTDVDYYCPVIKRPNHSFFFPSTYRLRHKLFFVPECHAP